MRPQAVAHRWPQASDQRARQSSGFREQHQQNDQREAHGGRARERGLLMGGHGTAAQSQTPNHDGHTLLDVALMHYDHQSPPRELTAASPPMGENTLPNVALLHNAHGWEGTKPKPCRARPAGETNEGEPLGVEVTATTSARDIQKNEGRPPFYYPVIYPCGVRNGWAFHSETPTSGYLSTTLVSCNLCTISPHLDRSSTPRGARLGVVAGSS